MESSAKNLMDSGMWTSESNHHTLKFGMHDVSKECGIPSPTQQCVDGNMCCVVTSRGTVR